MLPDVQAYRFFVVFRIIRCRALGALLRLDGRFPLCDSIVANGPWIVFWLGTILIQFVFFYFQPEFFHSQSQYFFPRASLAGPFRRRYKIRRQAWFSKPSTKILRSRLAHTGVCFGILGPNGAPARPRRSRSSRRYMSAIQASYCTVARRSLPRSRNSSRCARP
jgi:hypothetical protein